MAPNAMAGIAIRPVLADEMMRRLDEFGAVLLACVADGASVGFVEPFGATDATDYWRRKVLPAVRGGEVVILVAEMEGRILGTVQLDHDTMPNQRHRAEVRKLLVHPDFRRRGIARALMAEIETHARRLARSLLTLDTRSGDAAEPLYRDLGFDVAGMIPGYCRDTRSARLDATTLMYKRL
ncbi:GNAT family N-acetyltransferase [Dongia rigui]|uniref:GNAT family N-acetyltransferase n=1 Tax=Dongia rigui TaxID=940149 RepID=A0ABU5E015_9PROT|nr:GNAT family N-acetyltransferase [Dongia rigui]MDY0872865.1 GNAT family N-acetyltransferase [Dongia rigui]